MAGEGNKYIKETTSKKLRKLFQSYLARTPKKKRELELGKLNNDKTKATLPDGSVVDVIAVGNTGEYAAINKGIAYLPEPTRAIIDGKRSRGLILERYSDGLYIREVGREGRYAIPQILPSYITPASYVGGFSSDGNHMYIAGAKVNNDGAEVLVEWAIFKTIDIRSPGGGQSATFTYESTQTGQINLNSVFTDQVKPQIQAPVNAELTTPGLIGDGRCRYIFNYWYDEEAPTPPTEEEIQTFVDDLIDFFELTEDEVDILFPPSFWAGAYTAAQTNKFNPITDINFSSSNNPYEIVGYCGGVGLSPYLPGCTTFSTDEYTGFLDINVSADENIKPVFKEVNFAFNNDTSGNPVLDVIASYQTTTVYKYSSIEYDNTYEHANVNFGSIYLQSQGRYTRHDNEAYSYTYDENAVYSQETGPLSYTNTITNTPGGNNGWNFYLENDGIWYNRLEPQFPSTPTRYYSVAWFQDPNCSDLKRALYPAPFPGCDYYQEGTYEAATIMAAFTLYGGYPLIYTNLYPPDNNSYSYTYHDGSGIAYSAGVYPSKPTFFGTSYPYDDEPYFHGFYLFEDWAQTEPFADVFQFGRGVLAINNANTSPTYKYIDRPPASPGDFDHLPLTYLGVNGSRALLVKEDFFGAYAYSQEYVATDNQIVGLEAPDIFTDALYIDNGTWPIPYTFLKAVNSYDFIEYDLTQNESGFYSETLYNVHIDINPTVVTFNDKTGGTRPATFGQIMDYCIIGSEYD